MSSEEMKGYEVHLLNEGLLQGAGLGSEQHEVCDLVMNLFHGEDSSANTDVPAVCERVLKEFTGDKSTRLLNHGQGPSTASRDMMKDVITDYVTHNLPIPTLIVASACKLPLHGHIADLAEIFFIKNRFTSKPKCAQCIHLD